MTTTLKQQILRALFDAPAPTTSVEIRRQLIAENSDPGAGKLLIALLSLGDAGDVTSKPHSSGRRFELTEQGRGKVKAAQPSLINTKGEKICL